MATPAGWEHRIHRSVLIGQFLALVVAIASDFAATGAPTSSLIALSIATVYTLGLALTPARYFWFRFGAEFLTLMGMLLTMIAVTLTGAGDSPYLLLSMGPPILATIYGGFRTGLTTGLLGAGLLLLVSLAQDQSPITAAPGMALYLVFVLLVGVIRKLLEDIHSEAASLAVENASAAQRLEHLEEVHNVLVRLSQDVSAGRLNAVEVGAETLDLVLQRLPESAGKLAVSGEAGPVVLAARGVPHPDGQTHEIPIATSDRRVGVLQLVTKEPLSQQDRNEIQTYLRPLALAFANLQLLQEIAGSAVAEERTRLARELHDDIGPSLASLGLALDMAAMQNLADPSVSSDLKVLRSNVTKVVEDLRAKVADLRSAPGPTLTARLLALASTLDPDLGIVIDLNERRPPRPAIIDDITSLISEAIRNAHQHSQGSKIVVSGQLQRDWGSCSIKDDGIGFDPSHEPDGHFGLLGMRERAEKIDALLDFNSTNEGTTVTIEWGQR